MNPKEIPTRKPVFRTNNTHSDIGFQLIYSQVEKGEGTERWKSPQNSIV